MLEKFGRPTTLGESLREYLRTPPPARATLRERGEAVRVILEGEERVADGVYLGPSKRRRGQVRVRVADPRNAGTSATVTVERWRVLRKDGDDAHLGG